MKPHHARRVRVAVDAPPPPSRRLPVAAARGGRGHSLAHARTQPAAAPVNLQRARVSSWPPCCFQRARDSSWPPCSLWRWADQWRARCAARLPLILSPRRSIVDNSAACCAASKAGWRPSSWRASRSRRRVCPRPGRLGPPRRARRPRRRRVSPSAVRE